MLQFNFTPFPVLNTNRLILRKLLPSDADNILAMRSIPEVMQYIGRPLMQTQQEALELIEKITSVTREQNPNMSNDQMEMSISIMKKMMSPYITVPIVIVMNCFIALIHSLIIGAIVKKDPINSF